MGEGLRKKIVYNNYQFYENLPLQNYVEREQKKGFYLSKAYGRFGSFLLFKKEGEREPRYFRYRRASLKGEEEGQKAAVQEKPYYVISEKKSDGTGKDKENGVPVRGGLLLTAALLFLSCLFLVLRGKGMFGMENYAFRMILHSSFLLSFLFCFLGDGIDAWAGKGRIEDGRLIFIKRSRGKELLFRLGDGVRLFLILYSIGYVGMVLMGARELSLLVNLANIGLRCLVIGCLQQISWRRSYLSCLMFSLLIL